MCFNANEKIAHEWAEEKCANKASKEEGEVDEETAEGASRDGHFYLIIRLEEGAV